MLDMRLSPWLRERIQAVREVYEGGKGLGEALHETRLGISGPGNHRRSARLRHPARI